MLLTRALFACGLLAIMISHAQAQNSATSSSKIDESKQLIKDEKHYKKELRREKEKDHKGETSSERSAEATEKLARDKAAEAQAREQGLPSHEDHHKLGAHDKVDKGFDFNTSNSK